MYETYLPETGITATCFIPAANGFRLFYEHNNVIYSRESSDSGSSFSEPMAIFESPTKACISALRIDKYKILLVRKMNMTEEIKKLNLGGANHNCLLLDEKTGQLTDYGQIEQGNGCFYIMNDRLLQLKNGRIILPEAVHPREEYDKGLETAGLCGCSWSEDYGKTWKKSNWITANDTNNHLAEPMLVESNNENELFMFMRSSSGYMHKSVSLDNGKTWEVESKTSIRMPCAPFCVKRDPFSGYVFVVWDNAFPAHPQHQYPRSPICLGVSRDNTESWEFIFELDNNPLNSYGYPAMYFEKNKIIVSYYQSPSQYFYPEKHRIKFKVFERDEINVHKITYTGLFK